ncbi:MAG: SpoIIE family protein phosphatase [Bacteroidales bacterium]|nr:SpoIIE family protein phosphatase [Bacteroidales bacterium]
MAIKYRFVLLLFFSISSLLLKSQTEPDLLAKIAQEEKNGNQLKQAEYLNKLAYYYWEEKEYQKAHNTFEKSFVINSQIGNQNAKMNIYLNIAAIQTDAYQYETALVYFKKALRMAEDFNEKRQIAATHINIGVTLQKLSRFYEGIESIEKALEIAKTINDLKLIKNCYGVLSECYEKVGENDKSMEYFNLYATFEKHLQKEHLKEQEKQNNEKINQANSEVSKAKQKQKEVEGSLEINQQKLEESRKISIKQKIELQNKELAQKALEAELHSKRIMQGFIIGGLILTILFALFVLKSNQAKRKINNLLANQNKEILLSQEIIKKKNIDITKSITYAQRIQKAMLPNQERLVDLLPESFIFFSPRDLVSGDFFWFDYAAYKSYVQQCIGQKSLISDSLIITAVDCTGHGVPGAFMSLLGFNLLEQIVSNEITDPHKILDIMHIGISRELRQQQTDNKDGMDMAICRINKESKTVDFAGAKNPLVYIKNNEINVIKGDTFPIGGSQLKKRSPYKMHTISYADAPTSFYLFSDGYQDQFGGKDGQKFMSKNFRDLLFKISSQPMNEQKQILKSTLLEWMGDNNKQLDDILVIGFKLS